MDYAEFKAFLITFLWKAGDTVLINSLDNLILMGEAKLNRDLKVERRHKSVNLLVETDRLSLPSDYYSILQVTDYDTQLGEYKYVSPGELEEFRARNSSVWLPVYSIEGSALLLAGPTQSSRRSTGPTPPVSPTVGDLWFRTTVSPGLYVWTDDGDSEQWVQLDDSEPAATVTSVEKRLVVHYVAKIPNFYVEDTSWVADTYLDLLTYATLWHTAPFLREDERVATWQGYYTDALMSANDSSAFEQSRGVYGAMRLPTKAGIRRRKH